MAMMSATSEASQFTFSDMRILQIVVYYWRTFHYGPTIADLARESGLAESVAYLRVKELIDMGYLQWLQYLDGRNVPRSLQLTWEGHCALNRALTPKPKRRRKTEPLPLPTE